MMLGKKLALYALNILKLEPKSLFTLYVCILEAKFRFDNLCSYFIIYYESIGIMQFRYLPSKVYDDNNYFYIYQ